MRPSSRTNFIEAVRVTMGIGAIYATYNATYEATYEVTNFLEAVRVNMGIGKENPFEATYATYENIT